MKKIQVTDFVKKYFTDGPTELYHPVFGYEEEFSATHSGTNDRLPVLQSILRQFMESSGKRHIKILDIGCAQGYFDFSIKAEFGDAVSIHAIDIDTNSIKLCQMINDENKMNIRFDVCPMTTDFINSIKQDDYDVILLFNIMHWIAKMHGFLEARGMLETLAGKADILILEMALLQDAPDYWKGILPLSLMDWFCKIAFFKEIAKFPHHQTKVNRPMMIASNSYVHVNGVFFEFDEHNIKYNVKFSYLSTDRHIKYIRKNIKSDVSYKTSDAALKGLEDEKNSINIGWSFAPRIIEDEETEDFKIRIYKINRGIPLNDMDNIDNIENRFLDILNNLVEFESKGFYQVDFGAWNIIVSNDKSFLIDFESVTNDFNRCYLNKCGLVYPGYTITTQDLFCGTLYDVLTKNKKYEISWAKWPTIFFNKNLHSKKFHNFFVKAQAMNTPTFSQLREIYVLYVLQEKELVLPEFEKIFKINYKIRKEMFDLSVFNTKAISLNKIELDKKIAVFKRKYIKYKILNTLALGIIKIFRTRKNNYRNRLKVLKNICLQS